MKCKRENFSANQKFNRKEDKKINYHKKVNWFRAFMLMPWYYRIDIGQRELNRIFNYE